MIQYRERGAVRTVVTQNITWGRRSGQGSPSTGRGGDQDRGDPVQHREARTGVTQFNTGRGEGQDRGDPVQGGEEVRTGVTQFNTGRGEGQDRGDPVQHREVRTGVT